MSRKKSVSISRKPSLAETSPADVPEPAGLASLLADNSETARTGPPEPLDADNPPAQGLVGRIVYQSTYCVCFGVVFGALLLIKLVPGSGLITRGMRDGAQAAYRYAEHEEGSVPLADPAEPGFAA